MPSFAYSGRTRGGQTVSGERMADTMDAAVLALRREQILVTRIMPAKGKSAAAKKEKAGRAEKLGKFKNLAGFGRQVFFFLYARSPPGHFPSPLPSPQTQ